MPAVGGLGDQPFDAGCENLPLQPAAQDKPSAYIFIIVSRIPCTLYLTPLHLCLPELFARPSYFNYSILF